MSTRKDFYYWRIFATGLSFTVFGVGGLVLGLVIFPLTALITPDPERRVLRCRRVVHHSFRLFIEMMRCLGILTYTQHGLEHLEGGGKLIIGNHPTLIDIVFLISRIPNATCIVKSDLTRNLFMRGPVSWAGYIANDSPEELLDECSRQLEKGASLVVFPEGTRSVPGQMLRFKRGAAYIWLRSNCELILAILDSSPPTLSKNTKWYQIPDRKFHFTMDIREGIKTLPAMHSLREKQDARAINRLWQNHFQEELSS